MNEIEKTRLKEVANIIYKQLLTTTPANVFFSWGIYTMTPVTYNNMPSLKMMVNGRLHKGDVIISLNEVFDYYEIFLLNKNGLKKVAYDIDWSQLSDTIDRFIERGEDEAEYATFCEQERIKLIRGEL